MPAAESPPDPTEVDRRSRVVEDPPVTTVPGTGAGGGACTASQLRRFIRSRPYVPMHELRRRFALNGGADEMAAVDIEGQRLWVGLPVREGRLLADLLRGGDIGYEMSVDPVTPVIVGVYALRSIQRP